MILCDPFNIKTRVLNYFSSTYLPIAPIHSCDIKLKQYKYFYSSTTFLL